MLAMNTAAVGPDKRPWDMPTSLSNSMLETWTLADLSGPRRLNPKSGLSTIPE